jgi:hypothetical protein
MTPYVSCSRFPSETVLTAFGVTSLTFMMAMYALERRGSRLHPAATLFHVFGDITLAEDIAQETFVVASDRWRSDHDLGSIPASQGRGRGRYFMARCRGRA